LLTPPPKPKLFPYTTLFRSDRSDEEGCRSPAGDARKRLLAAHGERRRAGEAHAFAPKTILLDDPVGVDDDAGLRRRQVQRARRRSEEHTSELQSPDHLVCRL